MQTRRARRESDSANVPRFAVSPQPSSFILLRQIPNARG